MKHPSFNLSVGVLCLLPSVSSAALFTTGHADVFAIGYVDEETPGVFELEPHIHAEGATIGGTFYADEEFEPGDVTTVVPQSTFDYWTTNGGRPAGSAWDPIGVNAGESFYFLPQASGGPGGATALNAPFAGVGTEELTPGDWTGDITITLTGVTGPGHFSMYLDGFNPFFVMSTEDGIDATDAIVMAPGGHDHYNWAFSEAGLYSVDVTVSATHMTDGLQTASATYLFSVPEPGTAALGLLSFGLFLRRRR